MANNRYSIVHYTILGHECWRVIDVLNPDGRVKKLLAHVTKDEFDNESEASALCAQLNR
jgi:hypothetical protein